MLRLGASSWPVWRGVLATNGVAVAQEVRALTAILTTFAAALEAGETDSLGPSFDEAARAVQRLNRVFGDDMMQNNGMPRLAVFAAALWACPLVALAQGASPTVAPQYGYVPPKIVKHGTAATIPPGSGTVIVKVFVKKDGSAQVQGILKSSNHDLDAAALEIAKNSTYRPATNNQKPVEAFYDFTLKFAGGTASEPEASPGGLESYERMVTGSPPNYAGAKTGLENYLQSHPGDPTALNYLGAADYFLDDYDGASDAFEKTGDKLAPQFKTVAANAYTQAAVKESKAQNFDKSIALAKEAVDLDPSFANYNTLGLTQYNAGQYPAAIISLEKARTLGASGAPAVSADKRAAIDLNLVSAYLKAGQPDQAKKVAAEAAQLDPKNPGAQSAFTNYYNEQATAQMKAGNYSQAAGSFEQAATAATAQQTAALLWAEAAISYLQIKPDPNNAKAQTDAEKSLAIDPSGELGNYAEGVALANQGKKSDAIAHLNKASAAAKAGGGSPQIDAAVDAALKQLNGTK